MCPGRGGASLMYALGWGLYYVSKGGVLVCLRAESSVCVQGRGL